METVQKTLDRRILRTKRAIRNAFAKLLSEKPVNDITIRDITDLAEINRKTFYNYYKGIYELIDEIENGVVEQFEALLNEKDFRESMEDPYDVLFKLTGVLHSDPEFYSHFFTIGANSNLILKIVSMLKEKTKAALFSQIENSPEEIDLALEYVFSGMFAVFRNWFSSGQRQSVEEISQTISTICFQGINGIIRYQ